MPSDRNVTVPLAAPVTAVNWRAVGNPGTPSKLSALAPPVPVITLNVISVSSGVVTLSGTVSTTGARLIVSVSVSEPLLGAATLSWVTIVKTTAPLKSGTGT